MSREEWPGGSPASEKAELREDEDRPAVPDHAQTQSDVVVSHDNGRDAEQSTVLAVAAAKLYGSVLNGNLSADSDSAVLWHSIDTSAGGALVSTTVIGGSDGGTRRRWIDKMLFRSVWGAWPEDEPFDAAPPEADECAGVRVPAPKPVAPLDTGAVAVPAGIGRDRR